MQQKSHTPSPRPQSPRRPQIRPRQIGPSPRTALHTAAGPAITRPPPSRRPSTNIPALDTIDGVHDGHRMDPRLSPGGTVPPASSIGRRQRPSRDLARRAIDKADLRGVAGLPNRVLGGPGAVRPPVSDIEKEPLLPRRRHLVLRGGAPPRWKETAAPVFSPGSSAVHREGWPPVRSSPARPPA